MTPHDHSALRPTAGVRLAGWLAIPEPLVVEAAARGGFDWIGLDLQHGAWDLGTAFRAIQLLDALGVRVLIRIAEEELPLIPRVLDHGAAGIVLAMASTPDVVAAAIDRARYQPAGRRSYGGQRYGMRPEPPDVAEVRPAIYAMIESRDGMSAVRAIANLHGLAGLHIGPTDLALALGLGMDRTPPAFAAAIREIVAAAHASGLPVTMHAVAPDKAKEWVKMGIDELVLTTDIELLQSAFREMVAQTQSAIEGKAPEGAAAATVYGRP